MKKNPKIIAGLALTVLTLLAVASPEWFTESHMRCHHTEAIAPAVIAAIISAAASIGSKVYSNAKARKAGDKAVALQKDKEAILKNWFDREYNADATQRADAQQALTYATELMKQRNRAAQGRAAVMGGTEESVAAEKAANNKIYSDIVGNIAATGAQRKDKIADAYLQGQMNQKDAMSGIEMSRAGNTFNAGQNTASAAGDIDIQSIAEAFENDELKDKKGVKDAES